MKVMLEQLALDHQFPYNSIHNNDDFVFVVKWEQDR